MSDATSTSDPVAVRLGKGGRVTIPAKVRRAAGLREGDVLVFRAEGAGHVVLVTRSAISERVWAAAPNRPGGG